MKLELAGSYDAAFSAYLSAAQTYVFLIRHTTDAETKQRLRAVSAKLVERAERIKAARRKDVGPVQRDPLSLGTLSLTTVVEAVLTFLPHQRSKMPYSREVQRSIVDDTLAGLPAAALLLYKGAIRSICLL